MPDSIPEDISDRMPEDLPVRKCINIMVGITRSKVILSKTMRDQEIHFPKSKTPGTRRDFLVLKIRGESQGSLEKREGKKGGTLKILT